jgi:hypothetical protein
MKNKLLYPALGICALVFAFLVPMGCTVLLEPEKAVPVWNVVTPTVAQIIATLDPEAEYFFNDTLTDTSGNAHDGTPQGASPSYLTNDRPGTPLGKAVSFAAGTYASLAGTVHGDTYTISMWFKPNNVVNWTAIWFSKNGVFWSSLYPSSSLESGTNPCFRIRNETSDTYNDIVSVNPIIAGTWYHMVVSISPGEAQMWLNGVLVKRSSGSTQRNFYLPPTQFILGKELMPFATNTFDGLIAELRVFKRILTPAEIQALYN